MKPFKNKLAVTIVLLSVAFCGMIIYSLQSDANGISSSVSTVVSPLQKIVYNINSRVKETVDFFLNFSEVKLENEELKNKLLDTLEGQKVIKEETPQYIKENFIPVQKIKDKIEKLNDESHAEELEDIMIGKNYTITELVQYVLQELIEESEEK